MAGVIDDNDCWSLFGKPVAMIKMDAKLSKNHRPYYQIISKPSNNVVIFSPLKMQPINKIKKQRGGKYQAVDPIQNSTVTR